MEDTHTTHSLLRAITAVLVGLAVCMACSADLVWFDETGGSTGLERFTDLSASYYDFVGKSSDSIGFDDLTPGTTLSDQYAKSYGVTFLNTAGGSLKELSGAWPEGSKVVGDLEGYDGSYMPDGDTVYVKFGNYSKDDPFTIVFAEPVQTVGAFVSGNHRGGRHTLSLAAYDQDNQLIGTHVVQPWLLTSKRKYDNYESFFAARTDTPQISRVEIMDYSAMNPTNSLVIDNLAFGGSRIPEPGTLAALMSGLWLLLGVPGKQKH